MNSSSTEIKFNKEQANYGIEELKQCQKELYEADKLFYKGIMALASARGMDLILKEDAGINLYMPEKIVIECREEISNLIEDITAKVALVEGFNEEPKEASDKVQYKKVETDNNYKEVNGAVKIGTGTAIGIGGKEQLIETGTGDGTLVAQPMYGVPTPPESDPIYDVQPKYGAPCVPTSPESGPIAQPLYGVPTPPESDPIYDVQPKYGAPCVPTSPESGPIAQPLYGVPTPPESDPIYDVQPKYGAPCVPTPPESGPIAQPLYGVPTPPESDPIYDVQPKYGAPCVPDMGIPTPVPEIDPIYDVQPKYGAPCVPDMGIPTPVPEYDPIYDVQPKYGAPCAPIETPLYTAEPAPIPEYNPVGTNQPVNPETTQYHMTNEYESIPNTGIPGVIEKNYVSKHPRLIGGLAATIGLFGIPTMLSDDYDEIEEKRINGKED